MANETCLGSRYNFKKGLELCPNRKQCALFNPDNYKNYIRFEFVKDFRKCDKHLTTP